MSESLQHDKARPRLAWTLGDVAGIGPELVARAWALPTVHDVCRPIVLGNPAILDRWIRLFHLPFELVEVSRADLADPSLAGSADRMVCYNPSSADVESLAMGQVHAAAGQAAFDYLVEGIELATSGVVDGIVTLPLHKEGLHLAGHHYPGHTEILAEMTGTREFGMMLYRRGLGVVHVTLHMSMKQSLAHIKTAAIVEKVQLLDNMMRRLGIARPRLAVAALNPHASDGGLFGNEEETIISPAVERARELGLDVAGPIPTDTLFVRAAAGEFDGVTAMYHDQGHIALKLLGWKEAVNITVGLPIVRVSVAHGTAYDIVGKGLADPTSLVEAVRVASLLASTHPSVSE
ncbi:4-hydroxythreonine-4-phosphate dehydrogenase PdxA [bacterium]|nr:4-hydroxythreonine-4-phosphate dehydrogenase PdxA [bacterium]